MYKKIFMEGEKTRKKSCKEDGTEKKSHATVGKNPAEAVGKQKSCKLKIPLPTPPIIFLMACP